MLLRLRGERDERAWAEFLVLSEPLVLRMAFVALLVALFARPFLTAAATGSDRELLVILIDQSATMLLKGERGRLIDQAVAEAKKLIESAGERTRFEVAFFDHNVHPLTDSKAGDVSKPDAAQLASFVRSGGGLLVFTGDRVSAKSCSTLTDAGLTVGDIGEARVTNDLPWRLNQWDETHPIFEPLSDPQHGDLRRLIFAAYT